MNWSLYIADWGEPVITADWVDLGCGGMEVGSGKDFVLALGSGAQAQ